MQIQEDDLESIVGTKSYRSKAVKEALAQGRAAYGPITLEVDLEASLLTVDGPFFQSVLDLSQVTQTEDGASIKAVREEIDLIVREQTEEHLIEVYW